MITEAQQRYEKKRSQTREPLRKPFKNAAYLIRKGIPELVRRDESVRMLRLYGITIEQYETMRMAQGDRCAICQRLPRRLGRADLHIDHDVLTGKVRALLCSSCNRGLGFFGHSPEALRAAAQYLEVHET